MVNQKMIFLLGLTLFSFPFSLDAYNSPYERESNGGLVAAMALGALGAGALYSCFSEPSDNALIWDARRIFNSSSDKYRDALSIFENRFQLFYGRSSYFQLDVDEDLLYQLAVNKRGNNKIGFYLLYMNQSIKKLRYNKNRLAQRMQDLRFNRGVEVSSTYSYQTMQSIVDNIDYLVPRLDYLYAYMNHHSAYFDSYEYEDVLWKKYDKELESIRLYSGSVYYLAADFCAACIEKNRYVNSSVPYIDYVSSLRKEIEVMNSITTQMPYNYQGRISAARDLIANLDYIKMVVMQSDGYYHDLYS